MAYQYVCFLYARRHLAGHHNRYITLRLEFAAIAPEQAYAKICAGASAVQIYTSMVYQGLSVACDVAKGLDTLLARDGFATVAQAIGTQRDAWL